MRATSALKIKEKTRKKGLRKERQEGWRKLGTGAGERLALDNIVS